MIEPQKQLFRQESLDARHHRKVVMPPVLHQRGLALLWVAFITLAGLWLMFWSMEIPVYSSLRHIDENQFNASFPLGLGAVVYAGDHVVGRVEQIEGSIITVEFYNVSYERVFVIAATRRLGSYLPLIGFLFIL